MTERHLIQHVRKTTYGSTLSDIPGQPQRDDIQIIGEDNLSDVSDNLRWQKYSTHTLYLSRSTESCLKKKSADSIWFFKVKKKKKVQTVKLKNK